MAHLSEHSSTILEGESGYFESFHAVPNISEFMLCAVQELPELGGQWEGKVVWGRSQSQRLKHYETHKYTAVCGQPPTALADPPQQATNPS